MWLADLGTCQFDHRHTHIDSSYVQTAGREVRCHLARAAADLQHPRARAQPCRGHHPIDELGGIARSRAVVSTRDAVEEMSHSEPPLALAIALVRACREDGHWLRILQAELTPLG